MVSPSRKGQLVNQEKQETNLQSERWEHRSKAPTLGDSPPPHGMVEQEPLGPSEGSPPAVSLHASHLPPLPTHPPEGGTREGPRAGVGVG